MEPAASIPALVAGQSYVVLEEEYPGHPVPRLGGVDRVELTRDRLLLVTPPAWGVDQLPDVAERAFALEPTTTPAGAWVVGLCRAAGFEPAVRCTSTDLQVHLGFVRAGLAAEVLPELAARGHDAGVRCMDLPGRPERTISTVTREGGRTRLATTAVIDALRATC